MNNPEENVDSREHGMTARPLMVADVMTQHVITLSPHHSFYDAMSLIAKRSFRHFLVVDEGRKLVGVVSDRDILRVLARTTNWNTTSISQFMACDVFTVTSDTKLSVAVDKMLSRRINCLPVIDGESNLLGIVTSTDLLKACRSAQESWEAQANSLNSTIKL